MPFIPHTETDIKEMLATIGAPNIDALFDEIPEHLKAGHLNVPAGMCEMEITRLMHARAAEDGRPLSFIGAGAYEHHIPAAVWEITTRGEFYSAYTPYQAEASQGTLQVIYEYQTMMCGLTGMDVSNASLYEGGSALSEAVLMAVRANRKSKSKKILMPSTVHPFYRETTHGIVKNQGIVLENIQHNAETGCIDVASLEQYSGEDITAVVIPYPNFFGRIEDVDAITNWAHANKALVIAVANPTALALLKAPGSWGETGADIVCGEGQPLGAPLSSGGPYFGYMCCKQAFVRQLPGRIVGRTVDLDGTPGFTLTLQAREQHIRRSKATSNICTNQGLLVTAATIYMALLGAEGLKAVATQSVINTQDLQSKLTAIDGVEAVFSAPGFHEFVIRLNKPAQAVLDTLAEQNILGGVALEQWYPEMKDCILVCATETKIASDIEQYAHALRKL